MTETPPTPTNEPLHAALLAAVEALGECGAFRAAAPTGLADDEIIAGLVGAETLGRIADALRVRMAGEVKYRSRPELGGDGLASKSNFTGADALVAAATGVSRSTAKRRLSLGEKVRSSVSLMGIPNESRFPAIQDALSAGLIGVDAAEAIIRPLEEAAQGAGFTDEIRAAEAQLVEQAQQTCGGFSFTADQVHKLAIRAREHLNADGAEPRFKNLEAGRGMTFTETASGHTRMIAHLTPLQASVWRTLDHATQSPRARTSFVAEGSDPVGPERDDRTAPQRRVDTFTELVRLASELPGVTQINGASATINLHATLNDVITGRGVGWIDGIDEPVPASVIEQLLCDSDVITTLFGQHGQVLQHGKTRRFFTAAQNRALAARDGGCVWKGCDRPPSWTESHHVEDWRHDNHGPGRTDIDNGALLCHFHHAHVHHSDWQLTMVHGVPHLIPPRWVDPEQTPQRCAQQADRVSPPNPYRFDDKNHQGPRFTDAA